MSWRQRKTLVTADVANETRIFKSKFYSHTPKNLGQTLILPFIFVILHTRTQKRQNINVYAS